MTTENTLPYLDAPHDVLDFGAWAAAKVQERYPDQEIKIEWDVEAKLLLLQLHNYELVESGSLADIMIRLISTLEKQGYPFNVGFGDPQDPWFSVQHPY